MRVNDWSNCKNLQVVNITVIHKRTKKQRLTLLYNRKIKEI